MSESILATEGLSKRFGGLYAIKDVTLRISHPGVHAIIGPNGAGKSTMVDLLTGSVAPSSGYIRFCGRDITGLPPHRVAQLGIGRSYQRTNIFPKFTCLENCWLAAQSQLPSSLRFLFPAHRLNKVRERARRGLALCGLTDRCYTEAGQMSHGEQRQLEIGMVLATEPKLLIFDEPMAGMGGEESARVVELLQELAETYPIVLVEHDMDAVFSVASELTVMANGQMLANGSVATVRENPVVQEAYLGVGEGVS